MHTCIFLAYQQTFRILYGSFVTNTPWLHHAAHYSGALYGIQAGADDACLVAGSRASLRLFTADAWVHDMETALKLLWDLRVSRADSRSTAHVLVAAA